MAKPVLIVGAGLAGLVCAREMHRAGVPFLLLDADDRPGGRLKTDVTAEGFRLDRGFQVYFDAYPNASAQLDHDTLDLRAFRSGAQVYDGKLHLIDQGKPLAMLLSPFLSFGDKRKIAKLTAQAGARDVAEIRTMPDMTTEEYLRQQGFSDAFFERFARPFFGGVFLDRSLGVSRRQFLFVWKMLAAGRTCLPARGIEEIPKQIAADLPRYFLRESSRVAEVLLEGGRAVGVRLDTNERFEAAAVVLATDAETAARLSGQPTVAGAKSSTCLYFEAAMPVVEGGYLVLNASGRGRVNHVAPITNVAPEYAPPGRHLVSVTILGDDPLPDARLAAEVKREIEPWFPKAGVGMWHFLRRYDIPYAQMPQPPGIHGKLPRNETRTPGLYFAGEFTTNASIDGAIQSGVRCAARVLEREGAALAA